MQIKPKQLQINLHRYKIKADVNTYDLTLFITGDWHYDNPKTKRDVLHKHLDEAKEKNALIIINGDLLCLMQGKYDPRRSKSDILPEHNGNNYLDLVINNTAEKLAPYAHNILQINVGNHESSVSHRSETDILSRLVERINTIAGSNIQLGAYTGFIVLSLEGKGNHSRTYNVGYSHGHWGGVISKGTQASMRYSQMIPDADLMISGHTHDGWHMILSRYKYNQSKQTFEIKNQDHIKTGTYKEEFDKGSGWAIEKIGMPKVLVSYYVTLHYSRDKELQRTISTTQSYI